MITEGYELNCYCDFDDDSHMHNGILRRPGPAIESFHEKGKTIAHTKAKAHGWTILKDGRCLCPYCKMLGRTLDISTGS